MRRFELDGPGGSELRATIGRRPTLWALWYVGPWGFELRGIRLHIWRTIARRI